VSATQPLILGIDPGSRRTGYAAIVPERRVRLVESGTITLGRSGAQLSARLGELEQALEQLVARIQPTEVAVEDLFSARNARSALALGQARGVVLAVVGRRQLPVHAYAPATVKQAVTGSGRADKGQVRRTMEFLLSLDALPAPDEADAMAIAVCHALSLRRRMLERGG